MSGREGGGETERRGMQIKGAGGKEGGERKKRDADKGSGREGWERERGGLQIKGGGG